MPGAIVALLGLRTTARSVWLHPDAVAHIAAQRARAPGDAEFVLQHLTAAVLRPHWAALERDGRRVRLVHVVRAGSGHLFVALKCVAAAGAASGADEIWVSTAYRLGPRSLTRQLRAHSFVEIEANACGRKVAYRQAYPRGSRHRCRDGASGQAGFHGAPG